MRYLALALTALVMTFPALAGADDFSQAQAVGNWTGCVDQPGFDPYPVRLKATELGFDVDYPGLCSGQHSLIGALSSANALEVISKNAKNCITVMPVSYKLKNRKLSLEFIDKDSLLATAILMPGDRIANCAWDEAIS